MTYSVVDNGTKFELSAFDADDDKSALRYAEQNYSHHHNEVLYVRNLKTDRIIIYI